MAAKDTPKDSLKNKTHLLENTVPAPMQIYVIYFMSFIGKCKQSGN